MMLRIIIVLAILVPTVVSAQNVDVYAERATIDGQLLRALRGQSSLGSVAVWPQQVRHATAAGDAFGAYGRDYYRPLRADTTTGFLFAPDDDGRFRLLTVNDSLVRMQGDASLMVRTGMTHVQNTAEAFALVRPAVRFMGSLGENLGFFLDLSNGARLRGTSNRIALTDPTLARTYKFLVEEQSFFDRYVGYVQYQSEHLRVRFGREPIQFGFSPIDNMVHSLQAAPMDGLLIDVPYKAFRFTSTHSMVDGVDTAGKAVPTKFIATHRVAVDPTPWLSVAISDMIVYWNRGLDLAYLNPLAFFVSAGLGTEERSRTDNSILALDCAIRPWEGTMIYGSIVADDIAFSTIGDTSNLGNNNKYAWQIGASQLLDVGTMPLLISAEIVTMDPFVFAHRSIAASYTHMGAPVGYAMQPNSDRLAAQLRLWFTPRTSLRMDVDYTRNGENILDANGNILVGEDPRYPGSNLPAPIGNVGGDILRGDGDFLVGNRFLRGNVSFTRRINAWLSGEAWNNVFFDVRAGYENRNGGNRPGEFFFGSLELRVGY